MSWFSILPAHLTVVETWIIRFFLFLGTVTIIPWVLALIYDMLLYLIRAISYEIPYYGGRAQGKLRPQAPKLTERPNGRKRTFSISSPVGDGAVGSGKERRTGKEDESSEDEAVDLTFEESRAIQSTDLWDASTDSRFINGGIQTTKKRK